MSPPIEDSVDDFTITFRREILFYLRQLMNDGTQVSVVFNEGRDTFLTVFLDVDDEKNLLIFDWGGSEETNQRLLQSNKNYFIARPQGVRNQFVTGPVRATSYNKRQAFCVPIPEKYVRLQRREFFRLNLPISLRPACILNDRAGKSMELSVIDIGIGGVGLEATSLPLPCELGSVFSAQIEIKNQGPLTVDIKVCYKGQVARGDYQATRLGCQFENLTAGQENELQKLITHVQREERARMGG